MQVIAALLFWIVVILLMAAALLVSFAMESSAALRPTARSLRAGTLRSVAGAFAMQALSLPPFMVLLLATWSIQYVARQLGASYDAATWIGLPIGFCALVLPAVATLSGGYVGFRSGWLRANGREPALVLSEDTVAGWLRRLGPLSPERW